MDILFKAIALIKTATPIEAFIVGGILVYLVIKGIVKLPSWIRTKKEPKQTTGINSHMSCANWPSLVLLVRNAINKSAEIQRILMNETISEQMNEVDELYDDFRNILKANYLTLYRKIDNREIGGLLNEKDVQHFISILDSMQSMLKGLSRRFLKKNHFIEKSEEEFRLYIDERTEDYQSAISSFLDERYDSSVFKISREELYESHMTICKPKLQKKVERFFYKIRSISLEKREKVQSLEKEIGEFK